MTPGSWGSRVQHPRGEARNRVSAPPPETWVVSFESWLLLHEFKNTKKQPFSSNLLLLLYPFLWSFSRFQLKLTNSPALKCPQILFASVFSIKQPVSKLRCRAAAANTHTQTLPDKCFTCFKMLPLVHMKQAYKSQLNNWQPLRVAEDVRWQRRLCKLNVFISCVMCALCRSAGELSHTLHLAVSSREAEQRNPLFFFFLFLSFSSSVAPATWILSWISSCTVDR